jgi:two-component system, LytTR family, sensor kinase
MEFQSITQNIARRTGIPRWGLHVIYWIIWICFWGVMWGTYDNNYEKSFYIQILEIPYKLTFVYSVLYFFMPVYLERKRYLVFILFYLLLLAFLSILVKFTWYFFIESVYFPDRPHTMLRLTDQLNIILTLNTAMLIPIGLKMTEYWLFQQQKSNQLEKEKLQAELKFLRTQVNPHFLFNALNSIYALSLMKSELTSDTIARLSEIMRYLIYEADAASVSVENEVEFINSYIEFEKVRLNGEVDISFSLTNKRTGTIPPLLFIPLIENAFKHLKAFGTKHPWIVVQMELGNKQMKLLVENSAGSDLQEKKNGGLGIENLKKRLDLLYPNQYDLSLKKEEEVHYAKLTIFDQSPSLFSGKL